MATDEEDDDSDDYSNFKTPPDASEPPNTGEIVFMPDPMPICI